MALLALSQAGVLRTTSNIWAGHDRHGILNGLDLLEIKRLERALCIKALQVLLTVVASRCNIRKITIIFTFFKRHRLKHWPAHCGR